MNGNRLIIKRAGTAIAASKSMEIDTYSETEDLSNYGNATGNRWKRYIASRYGWSVTSSWLVTSSSIVSGNLLSVGARYQLEVAYNEPGSSATTLVTGYAICTRCKITATIGSLVNGSFEFLGDGPLVNPSAVSD